MARKKKEPVAAPPEDDTEVLVLSDDGEVQPEVSEDLGSIEIPLPDGSFVIDFNPQAAEAPDTDFDDNLAEHIDELELARIANELLEAVEQDERDRAEWLTTRANGLDLLGQKIEMPGSGNVGASSTAVAGQSTVRDALLAEACDRFQANSFAELCPSSGPVKFENFGDETTLSDKDAKDLEDDFNFYLTGSGPHTATEYYPDTRKMLWWTGFASGMFKKVYHCPLRNRPVSESVDGADLIVPSNATDLQNAGRVTHCITMRPAVLRRMQILGEYRDVTIPEPTSRSNALKDAVAEVTGSNARPQREADQDYAILESYCELDIAGFEHKKGKEPTGLPLPYRVTLDRDSRTILQIKRNWRQPDADADDDQLPVAKIPFVPFFYATGLGFYGTGLLHRLGNYAMALTAMLRELIDAGMFASFPGFLYAKPMGRQIQNEFRVPPGGGAPIDVSAVGGNINNAVMPLPYKDVSAALVALAAQVRQNAERYGGTAEAPTSEGVANAPVGSVLASIEQATRIEGGVHKALYAAQREEFRQLKELFLEDPDALWRGNRKAKFGGPAGTARRQRLANALSNGDLVPASDPNVPSRMHRLAKATTYLQTAMALPGLFDMHKVLTRWASMVEIDDIVGDFAPPQQQQPDPLLMAQVAIKNREVAVKEGKLSLDAQLGQAKIQSNESIQAAKLASSHAADADRNAPQQVDPLQSRALDLKHMQIVDARAKMAIDAHQANLDRDSKESVEALKLAAVVGVHPESKPIVDQQMGQLSPLIEPVMGPSGGMADGGPVDAKFEEAPPADADDPVAAVETALRIARLAGVYREFSHPGSAYLPASWPRNDEKV